MRQSWVLLLALITGAANARDVGRNSNGVDFALFDGGMTYVGVSPSAIPGTTLLIQSMKGDTLMKNCIFLVKGKVENQRDIDALKPDSVLQMSCTPVIVRTRNADE